MGCKYTLEFHNIQEIVDIELMFELTCMFYSFPVAQLVEHGASNAKIMGSIPRESKSW